MTPDVQSALLGTLFGLGVSTLFVLALLIGFCVIVGLPKLRQAGGRTKVVRSLDEMMGERATFFSPDTPHGPVDQLRTPELLEAKKAS